MVKFVDQTVNEISNQVDVKRDTDIGSKYDPQETAKNVYKSIEYIDTEEDKIKFTKYTSSSSMDDNKERQIIYSSFHDSKHTVDEKDNKMSDISELSEIDSKESSIKEKKIGLDSQNKMPTTLKFKQEFMDGSHSKTVDMPIKETYLEVEAVIDITDKKTEPISEATAFKGDKISQETLLKLELTDDNVGDKENLNGTVLTSVVPSNLCQISIESATKTTVDKCQVKDESEISFKCDNRIHENVETNEDKSMNRNKVSETDEIFDKKDFKSHYDTLIDVSEQMSKYEKKENIVTIEEMSDSFKQTKSHLEQDILNEEQTTLQRKKEFASDLIIQSENSKKNTEHDTSIDYKDESQLKLSLSKKSESHDNEKFESETKKDFDESIGPISKDVCIISSNIAGYPEEALLPSKPITGFITPLTVPVSPSTSKICSIDMKDGMEKEYKDTIPDNVNICSTIFNMLSEEAHQELKISNFKNNVMCESFYGALPGDECVELEAQIEPSYLFEITNAKYFSKSSEIKTDKSDANENKNSEKTSKSVSITKDSSSNIKEKYFFDTKESCDKELQLKHQYADDKSSDTDRNRICLYEITQAKSFISRTDEDESKEQSHTITLWGKYMYVPSFFFFVQIN